MSRTSSGKLAVADIGPDQGVVVRGQGAENLHGGLMGHGLGIAHPAREALGDRQYDRGAGLDQLVPVGCRVLFDPLHQALVVDRAQVRVPHEQQIEVTHGTDTRRRFRRGSEGVLLAAGPAAPL